MTEEKEESTSEEEKLKAGEMKKHVGELLIYMDESGEREDYEGVLEDDPEQAKDHCWAHIKAIADCIGLTVDEAWKLYKKEEQ